MTDFDGDGMLDLILSHGESMAQPLSVFRGSQVGMDLGAHSAQPGELQGLGWVNTEKPECCLTGVVGNGNPRAWRKEINS